MEERKLNFSAPLLSVRRISASPVSTNADSGKVTPRLANGRHTLPPPKSDFSLEQVTKPVAVPFHWEDMPGRSKEGEEPNIHSREEASVTPRLPPGKLVDVKMKPSEKEQADQKAIRPYFKSFSSNETAMEAKCSNEKVNERRASKFEDEDDVYSDAHETLSPPTESFSMNCSATGTNQSHSANVKPSIDPQTRDFMMKRFLPAAKAMALETPHIAIKKQQYSAPLEQPRQVTRVIRQDTSPLPIQQRSHMEVMELVQYSLYKEEEESEEEEVEYDDPGYITPKGCGLFPRLGMRNSLCPLPVPAMKAKARALMSCSSSVAMPGKNTRSRSHSQPLKPFIKTTSSQSHSQPLNKVIKPAYTQSHSQPLNRVIKPADSQSHCHPLNKGAAYNLKADRRCYSGELPRLVNNQAAQSNMFRHSGEQPKGKSSPFRQSRSPCISPYRNERPKSPFTGAGFLGVPKEESVKANSSKFNMNDKVGHKSQEVLSHQRNKQGPYTVIPMIEKTLYVDTVNTTKTSRRNSSSVDTKGRVDSAVEDLRTILKRSGMEESPKEKSLFQDIKCLTTFESNVISEPAVLESEVDTSSSYSDRSHIKCQVVAVDSQLGVDIRSDDIMKEDPGNANSIVVQSPLPPPLPKSPSHSWLSSTLSSTPSRNSVSTGTKRHTKRSSSKTSSTGTKWETIVKTSNLHHDHVRYSEELITHVSQQSKS